MKKILTMIAAAMFLGACSNDDGTTQEGYQPSTTPIAFQVDAVSPTTRAVGEIASTEALQQLGKFGVFASYTGNVKYASTSVSPDFMYNQEVFWSNSGTTGHWDYAPIKYWPNEDSDFLSFFAYAPYESAPNATKCIFDLSHNDDKGDPWLNYQIAEDPWSATNGQQDLMWGMKQEGTGSDITYKPWVDQYKSAFQVSAVEGAQSMLTFTFRHALACFGDDITLRLTANLANMLTGGASLEVYKFTIDYRNLTSKARLVLNSADGEPNWKEIISGELTTTRTYTKEYTTPLTLSKTATAVDIAQGDGLLYIPMQVEGTEPAEAVITVYYKMNINGTRYPAAGDEYTTASASYTLLNHVSGKSTAGTKQAVNLTMNENLELGVLVYNLDGDAQHPSYAPKF